MRFGASRSQTTNRVLRIKVVWGRPTSFDFAIKTAPKIKKNIHDFKLVNKEMRLFVLQPHFNLKIQAVFQAIYL